ncbi:MAG: bacteriophage Gp15 family protein [Tetragenococcus koreensis]|nr:bacteriophage Gp15 family protein [Tetragenococcus koreensis]
MDYDGHTIGINFSFDSILKCFDIAQNDVFREYEKVLVMFRVLVKDYEQYSTFNLKDRDSVVKLIFDTFMEYKEKDEDDEDDVPVIDYSIDSERIYTSFLMIGIDLQDEIGKMDWDKFNAIFNNLPEDSPIMKAVGYRVMTIPSEKDVGKKERQRLLKLKKHYELPQQKEAREKETLEALENLRNKGRR